MPRTPAGGQTATSAGIELLVFPYSAALGRSMLHVLIEELTSQQWSKFQAAVAFAKTSGNSPELLDAMHAFASRGGIVSLTFGADSFSGENHGSDYDTIEQLLQRFEDVPSAKVHLYHEQGRTFHPKTYVFSNENRALLIVGSSNWSAGGFCSNVEANLLVRLNLNDVANKRIYDQMQDCFAKYWSHA